MSHLRIPVGEHDHSTGPADAPVTVVEYGDYECPYCRDAEPLVRELIESERGRIRFVFRNFPLDEVHPHAVEAAYVAEFAADGGRFWEAHDLLYAHQDELGSDLYTRICQHLDLPLRDLEAAFEQRRYAARIEADLDGGIRSGVNGTPTFFVNGVRVDEGTAGLADAVAAALAAAR